MTDTAVMLQRAVGYHKDGRHAEAEDAYRSVLLRDPHDLNAAHLLGVVLHEQGCSAEGEPLIESACRRSPCAGFYRNLGAVKGARGDHDGSVAAYRRAMALDPRDAQAHLDLIFALDLHPHATPEMRLEERRRFDATFCRPLTEAAPPHENGRDPDRRLRIGYVSGDFRHHSASMTFGPVLEHLDRERFDMFLYRTDPREDDTTEFFCQISTQWRGVWGYDDEELAKVIREDRIDILVDLSGFSAGNRLLTFARKPAPIQATGWGYATGTGLSAMDYFLADAVAVPPEHEHLYAERIARLPCLLAYDPGEDVPEVGPPPVQRNGYVTFGYLGRATKLNPPVLAAWGQILMRVPDSRLLLKSDQYRDDGVRARIVDALLAFGVDERRVEFRHATPRRQHLEAYSDVDVALDPWPMGGGVTFCDGLLMGVPTVTLLGDGVPGRVGASILSTVGMVPDHGDTRMAPTMEGYIKTAVHVAALARTARRHDRVALRVMLRQSPLLDGVAYAKAVEDEYRAMWRRWCDERGGLRRTGPSTESASGQGDRTPIAPPQEAGVL